MTSTVLTRRTAALLMLASLTACGGGGGGGSDSGGGGTDGGSGGGGGGGGGATVNTGQYRLLPAANSFASALATANAQGAQGYALMSSLATMTSPTTNVVGDFYLSDTAHKNARLDYLADPEPGSVGELLAQLNQRGSQGYLLKSGAVFPGNEQDVRSLYVRDSSIQRTYTYETAAAWNGMDAKSFGEQLNKQGARGFRWVGPMMLGEQMFGLYVKDSTATTYEYTLDTLGTGQYTEANGKALQSALDTQGAAGRLTRGALILAKEVTVSVYEKSSQQQGAIRYLLDAASSVEPLESMNARFNTNAAKGFFFLTGSVTADGAMFAISVFNAVSLTNPLAGPTFP